MPTSYYAVCDANGPISVLLKADTESEARAAWEALDGHAAVDDASTDLEDSLDISGEGMSLGEFAAAAQAAGARLVRELDREWSLWAVEVPESTRCEAGEIGDGWAECQRTAATVVEYMPRQHRAAHEAAGNRGSWPDNGSFRVHLCRFCAGAVLETEGDWATEVAS